MIFSLNGNVIMTYSTLDEKYKRFFIRGSSLHSRFNSHQKPDYVKCGISRGVEYVEVAYYSLFNRYMNDDIFIKWKRDNDIFNIG